MKDNPGFNCADCKGRKKKVRNCDNVNGYKKTLSNKGEWGLWPPALKPAIKLGDLKLYECPLTAITGRTWDIIRIVNQTTDDSGKILHMPYPGSYLEQPEWYREAVEITQRERAEHRRKQLDKA